MVRLRSGRLITTVIVTCWLLCGLQTVARAQTYSLADANAQLSINFDDPLVVQAWTVDGVALTGESGYWYGYNHPGSPPAITISQQTAANKLDVSWYFLGLGAGVTYELQGGHTGSGEATLAESFWVLNAFPGATQFKLFSFNHYDLSGGSGTGRAIMLDSNTLEQQGSLATLEVSVSANPAHYEIGDPSALLTHVSDIPPVGPRGDLNDTPPFGVAYPDIPGDMAFAFQWNPAVGPFESRNVATTTKHVMIHRISTIPEPGGLLLLCMGGIPVIGALIRRR
jgi:hypothetical protein